MTENQYSDRLLYGICKVYYYIVYYLYTIKRLVWNNIVVDILPIYNDNSVLYIYTWMYDYNPTIQTSKSYLSNVRDVSSFFKIDYKYCTRINI